MKCEIGIRAHDLPIFDNITDLTTELSHYHLDNIQFSPKFSLKESTRNGEKMSFGLAHHSKMILNQKGINVAILGCYVNIIHPDKQTREEAIQLFQQYLSYAKVMGCPLVATETGSIDNVYSPHQENWTDTVFELTIKQIKQLTNVAEKLGMFVGIEPGVNHPIHDVISTKKLIGKVNSPNLKIVFDPTNMILNPLDSETEIVNEGIKEFGDEIYAFHIKDYDFKDGEKVIVPFGTGLAPMKKIAQIIKNFKTRPYVLMEETPKNHFEQSVKKFKELFC